MDVSQSLKIIGAAIAVGVITGAGAMALQEGLHQYRVWKAGGNWCLMISPDAHIRPEYGTACDS
jgi:hypothetical protein